MIASERLPARRATTPDGGPGYRAAVARDAGEILGIAAETEFLQRTPRSDLRALLATASDGAAAGRPWVVVVRRGTTPVALAAGLLARRPLECRVGYLTLASLPQRCVTFLPGSIVADDPRACRALLECLGGALSSGEGDSVRLEGLPAGSPLASAATALAGGPLADPCPDVGVHWTFPIPASYDAYLRSRSERMRKATRHGANRLRRAFGDSLRVHSFRDRGDLDGLVADLEGIARNSYQRALGVGFVDSPATRAWFAHAMDRGWFRAWVAYVAGRPAAFSWGIAHGGVYHAHDAAYDSSLRRFGIGSYLAQREIADLCGEGRDLVYDFGFGDDEYKRRHATDQRVVTSLWLFAPTARGKGLRCARAASAVFHRGLKEAAHRLGCFGPARKWVRGLLEHRHRGDRVRLFAVLQCLVAGS